LELFPDTRNRSVLQAALDEFQEGHKLQQLYQQTKDGMTITVFAPQDVEKRIRSIRTLMGYEPITEPDMQLVMHFTSFLAAVEPGGTDKVLQFETGATRTAPDRGQGKEGKPSPN
jgi:hypothetical protein